MKKVLHVIGTLKVGGAENMASNYARYINDKNIRNDYLVFDKNKGYYEAELEALGSKILRIDKKNISIIEYYFELYKMIKKNEYDIVHSHTFYNNGVTLFIAKLAGVNKRISHSHSTNPGKKITVLYRLYMMFMSTLINFFATDYVSCGEEAGKYLYGKKFQDKGVIIPNIIDLEKYQYNEKISKFKRRELNFEGQKIYAHIGRLTQVKNHDFLLDVFFEILKENQDSILLLIGDGELKSTIQKKISTLKIEKNVKLLGQRHDIDELLQIIDCILFPSLYEGVPVALIEAQAVGVSICASDQVSKEVAITENIEFISLDNLEKWVFCALEKAERGVYKNNNRIVQQKGYSKENFIKKNKKLYNLEGF